MSANNLVVILLFTSCWLGSEADQCDLFHNGLLCSLDPISNIEGAVFDLESELECQQECDSNINCNFFMFASFTNRHSDCFLLTKCNTNTTSCKDTPDCNFSVTGPKTPSITEACCQEFQDVTCERESEIGHFYDVVEATECQSLCRGASGCRYWSLYGEICFLYTDCSYPHPCSSICTSGPVFLCDSKDVFDTLLLGGDTSSGYLSTSVELITPNMTCTPQINQLPVRRRLSSAAVLGSRIFFCGGSDGSDYASCHSFDLDSEDNEGWEEEASMVFEKYGFSLLPVGDMLLAIGGISNGDPLSSVELFTLEKGWRLDAKLEMESTKFYHCSVAIGPWLFTIGGNVGGKTSISNAVEAFDTRLMSTNDSVTWMKKASMIEKRKTHGCHVGVFGSQEGIYVAGGTNDHYQDLASAEFYNPLDDRWQAIGSLKTGRTFFPMTILGEKLIISGGEPGLLTNVDTWNGSSWVELTNLVVGRAYHAAVSIKAGKLACSGKR